MADYLAAFDRESKSDIQHYGVLGMKWGVRRYRNEDGTLTEEGRIRKRELENYKRNEPFTDDVNSIVRALSDIDKERIGVSKDEDWIEDDAKYEMLSQIPKTFVTKHENVPAAFFQFYEQSNGNLGVSVGVRPEYQGMGYGSAISKRGIDWAKKYAGRSAKSIDWYVRNDNPASARLAEKNGFTKSDYSEEINGEAWSKYELNLRKK